MFEKIEKLLSYFRQNRADAQDIGAIASWEDEAKRLFLIKSLKDHDGIRYVLEIFESEVKKINERLNSAYSKDLPDTERDRLLDKRELAKKYLDLFSGVEEDLDSLEENLDTELSKLS